MNRAGKLAGMCAVGFYLGLSAQLFRAESLATAAKSVSSTTRKPALPLAALGVPLSRQETDYSCGPAAMRSILKYFDVWDGPEQELYALAETSEQRGSLPENLVHVAQHFGLSAVVEQHMTIFRLQNLLAFGKVVILELQAWRPEERVGIPWRDLWEDGHFVVLVGLDEEFAYFMDPSTEKAYTYLPIDELIERWHDINPMRKVPFEPRDLELGVIISRKAHHPKHRPATRRLVRLD